MRFGMSGCFLPADMNDLTPETGADRLRRRAGVAMEGGVEKWRA